MGFVAAYAFQRCVAVHRSESTASRQLGLGLDSLARRGHARRPIQRSTESFGSPPGGAPVHARGQRTPIAIRGRGVVAEFLRRPPNVALNLASDLWIALARGERFY